MFRFSVRLTHFISFATISRRSVALNSLNRPFHLGSSRMNSAPNAVVINGENGVSKLCDNILKSENDNRSYRGFELGNGLKVLLISDPLTDKSSASLDVNIGSMSDPQELPGLAHFLEHMLFLGTAKYTEENAYSKYVTQHGGSSNAFTSGTHTNYYFDISPSHLQGALDIFAQFFICPLFTESATDREVNAVNSEHERNLDDDSWRVMQVDKCTSDPGHDYSKFGTGNKSTLKLLPESNGVDVRTKLLEFHSQWYSANIMALTVLGKESVDDLLEMVVSRFANVQNKNAVVPKWEQHPYRAEELSKEINIVPIRDTRALALSFPIPDLHGHYKSQPEHYIAHLIGHEGPGSLLSELKSRGWVNYLNAYDSLGAKGFGFFHIHVDLTTDGIDKIDDIIELMFQYLNMIKRETPKEWIFEECAQLNLIKFRFKDKEHPISYTRTISSLIHDYPMEDVLSGCYLMKEFRPDLISDLWTRLTPHNLRLTVIGKKFEGKTESTEKWYGTEYNIKDLSKETIRKWADAGFNENFYLPSPNEFIPSSFELMPREEKQTFPELIRNTDFSCVWFLQDNEYLLPKAFYGFEMTNPISYLDPLNATATALFTRLFRDTLNEYAYAAELAGLSYGFYSTRYGVILEVGGYNEKLHLLISKILDKMTTFELDPKRFEILKELHFRSLKNYKTQALRELLRYYTLLLTSERCWSYEEMINVEEDLTFERMNEFVGQMFAKVHVEALVHGNVTKQEALGAVDIIESHLKERLKSRTPLRSQMHRNRECCLEEGSSYVFQVSNPVHQTKAIEMYFQTGLQSTLSNVTLEFLAHILSEPCFNVLRTQEQLGYIVFSSLRRTFGVQGFRVVIQSDRDPEYLDGRIEAFLSFAQNYLEEMADEEFETNKKGLITKRLEKPKRLISFSKKIFEEIDSKQYHFDRDAVEIKALEKLTKQDVLDFFKKHITHDAKHRKKLSVRIVTERPSNEVTDNKAVDGLRLPPKITTEPVVIDDIQCFKNGLGLYPLLPPYIDLNQSKSKL